MIVEFLFIAKTKNIYLNKENRKEHENEYILLSTLGKKNVQNKKLLNHHREK